MGEFPGLWPCTNPMLLPSILIFQNVGFLRGRAPWNGEWLESQRCVTGTFLSPDSVERADGSEGLGCDWNRTRSVAITFWKTLHLIITLMTLVSDRGHNV